MEDPTKRFGDLISKDTVIRDMIDGVAQFWWERGFKQGRDYQKEQANVEMYAGNIVYFLLGIMASLFVSMLFSI